MKKEWPKAPWIVRSDMINRPWLYKPWVVRMVRVDGRISYVSGLLTRADARRCKKFFWRGHPKYIKRMVVERNNLLKEVE